MKESLYHFRTLLLLNDLCRCDCSYLRSSLSRICSRDLLRLKRCCCALGSDLGSLAARHSEGEGNQSMSQIEAVTWDESLTARKSIVVLSEVEIERHPHVTWELLSKLVTVSGT